MTGLEKMIAEIQEEAATEAAGLIADASAKAQALLATAQAESDQVVRGILAAGEAEAADTLRGGDSAAQLQRRQRILAQKQAFIAQVLDQALARLCALPDDQYFALIVTMAARQAQPGDGSLLLSARDMARLPADFAQRLADALPKGARLTPTAAQVQDGGFVLAYGDIEINCTFRAVMDAQRDALEDLAQKELFS